MINLILFQYSKYQSIWFFNVGEYIIVHTRRERFRRCSSSPGRCSLPTLDWCPRNDFRLADYSSLKKFQAFYGHTCRSFVHVPFLVLFIYKCRSTMKNSKKYSNTIQSLKSLEIPKQKTVVSVYGIKLTE